MVTTGNKKRGRRFDRGGSRTPRSAALAAKLMAVARDPLTLIRETARARRNQYCLSFALNPLAPVRPSRSWMAFHHNDPLIVPSRRPISIIHTAKARHATGPPNPSADFIIGEVRGHDRRTKGRRSRSSGAAYIILQIARVDFDFPAAHSGDGTRDNNCGVAHPSWLHRFLVAPCMTQTPLLIDLLAHPLLLQRLVLAMCVAQMPPLTALLAHPLLLQCLVLVPCVTQTLPLTAPLAHPSWLQRVLTPCVTQTPPYRALCWCTHPFCNSYYTCMLAN